MKTTIQLDGKTYDASIVLRERFGVTALTIWRWRKAGFLPAALKVGTNHFYERGAVEQLLIHKGTAGNETA